MARKQGGKSQSEGEQNFQIGTGAKAISVGDETRGGWEMIEMFIYVCLLGMVMVALWSAGRLRETRQRLRRAEQYVAKLERDVAVLLKIVEREAVIEAMLDTRSNQ